ncbi:MAG: AraC family transcriptional regulator [Bacteroidales bacterium]|nr:AraC family transcriptional regulator [Bacteroidales bacterium]
MKQGFFIITTVCVALSLWLSRYISVATFEEVLSPLLFTITVTVAFFGSFLVFKHADGLRIRRVWGWTLLIWGLIDSTYLVGHIFAHSQIMDMGAQHITTIELFLGNLLGWVLLLYPTEAVRPGWLSVKTGLWQVLPMCVLIGLDYLIPLSLRPLIALYPLALIPLLLTHIRVYKNWCEENFSTLDAFDVQWIIRYMWMVVLVGVNYIFICVTQAPARGFTQLWFTIFMFAYSTEQILCRKDPWEMVRGREKAEEPEPEAVSSQDALRQKLDLWMEQEKPYVNPAFQLSDLGAVLPMNRTYLSQFIKAEYGCTFYQFVSRYRLAEAKRLKLEQPDLKMDEIAARCGFSSRTVFSNVFTREEGVSPREWFKKCNPE